MAYHALSFEKSGHCLTVTIERLIDESVETGELAAEIADLSREILWDDDIRVVVVTGAGDDTFADPGDPAVPMSRLMMAQEAEPGKPAEALAEIDRPVIAALSGEVSGQGLEMMLACDLRIGDATCRFGFPQVQKGFMPSDGGTQRLPRLVGKGNALDMMLTGRMIDAEEARRIGLLHKIEPAGKLLSAVKKASDAMAAAGPIALRYAKEAVCQGMDMTLEQGLRLEADLYLHLHTTADRTEGVRAFRGRRAPEFKSE